MALYATMPARAQNQDRPASSSGSEEHVLKFGRDRTYWLHLPRGADESQKLPLVLMFHGAGGHGRWTAGETGWNDKADREGFIVVYPDGTPARPDATANFLTNPRLWNDGSGRGAIGRLNVDDVGFVNALLDELIARHPVDPQRIYATGFSNGAGMTFHLGAKLSTRLAAIAPVASHCWLADPRPQRPIPTLYIIGADDPLVPYLGGDARTPWSLKPEKKPPVAETLTKWAKALGCPAESRVLRDENGVKEFRFGPGREESELLVYTVEGLGHHWPGGKGQLKEEIAGKKSEKLNADDVIWDFFKRHKLP
jgi:polyhydroxybutyrate depolymerase